MPDRPTMTAADSGGGRRPWLRPVDFTTPRAIAPDVEARLRRLVEDFCALAGARAMIEHALPLELTPLWMHEAPWRDVQGTPSDGAIALVLRSAVGSGGLLVVDPALAAMVVERLLGGEPDPARPLRAATATDRALLRRLFDLLAGAASQLWDEATGTEIVIDEVRPHRELVAFADGPQRTVVAAIEVRMGGMHALLHVLLPHSAIAPVARKLARPSTRGDEDADAARAVHERIARANLDVRAELAGTRLSAREVAALQPGTRLRLRARAGDPAALRSDGVAVQYGHLGRSGNRRAVRIGAARPEDRA